jgi:hypothetical protein
MEKEHWISQILDSTNSITPVSPPMGLFGKIENKIKQQQIVSPTWIGWPPRLLRS